MPALSPTPGPDRDDGDAATEAGQAIDESAGGDAVDGSAGGDAVDGSAGGDAVDGASDLVCVAEPTPQGTECTVFPRDVDEVAVTTTWLTVDADTVCDLAAWR